jgi:hypothetical protein
VVAQARRGSELATIRAFRAVRSESTAATHWAGTA